MEPSNLIYDEHFKMTLPPRGEPGTYCGIISNICFNRSEEFRNLRLFIEDKVAKISKLSTKPDELKQRLRCENEFLGAFAELACFHLLDCIGAKDTTHCPRHKDHTPDFECCIERTCFLLEVLSKGEPKSLRDQPIVGGGKAAFVPSTEKRLREKLIGKAEKYNKLGLPVITCLVSNQDSSLPLRVKQCEWLFYGPEIQLLSSGNLSRERRTKYFPSGEKAFGGGLFNNKDVEYIGDYVSGHIDIFHELGKQRFEITIFRNPYAKEVIPDVLFEHFASYFETNEVVEKEDGEYILTYGGIQYRS